MDEETGNPQSIISALQNIATALYAFGVAITKAVLTPANP
jgi:hypothetical protein